MVSPLPYLNSARLPHGLTSSPAIMRDAENYFRGGPEWDLLTESNMQQYRAQRRHLGPVYTMNGLKRHEHHVDEVLREFLTKMTGELAGQSIELDHWIHVYALGEWSELLVKEEKARRKGPTDLYT